MKRRKPNTDIHTGRMSCEDEGRDGLMHYNPRNAKDCQHNTGS